MYQAFSRCSCYTFIEVLRKSKGLPSSVCPLKNKFNALRIFDFPISLFPTITFKSANPSEIIKWCIERKFLISIRLCIPNYCNFKLTSPQTPVFKILCLKVSACCKLVVMVSSILSHTVSLASNSSTTACCSFERAINKIKILEFRFIQYRKGCSGSIIRNPFLKFWCNNLIVNKIRIVFF